MSEIADILQMTFDDVPTRQTLPDGDYLFAVSPKYSVEVNDNGNAYLNWSLVPVEILSSSGGDDLNLANCFPVRHKLYLTDKSMGMTKDVFEKFMGYDTSGKTLEEIFEDLVGMTIRGTTESGEGKNGRPWTGIKKFLRKDT